MIRYIFFSTAFGIKKNKKCDRVQRQILLIKFKQIFTSFQNKKKAKLSQTIDNH